jgi:hypothetical protein
MPQMTPENKRGVYRVSPSTGLGEIVSPNVRERDLKSPDKGKKKAETRIKISTGNTRIGNMAGGGMGGMFGIKNR